MVDLQDQVHPPFRETLAATLTRTLAIAAGVTTLLAIVLPRDESLFFMWVITYPAVLWFPLGGHYVELVYLNFWRQRSVWARKNHTIARPLVWMLGGLPLGLGCRATWIALGYEQAGMLPWWWGVLFFPFVECIVHTINSVTGKPSFWNRRPEVGNLNTTQDEHHSG